MNAGGADRRGEDSQCAGLVDRIHELQAELQLESDRPRSRQLHREVRLLVRRAQCLGCRGAAQPNTADAGR